MPIRYGPVMVRIMTLIGILRKTGRKPKIAAKTTKIMANYNPNRWHTDSPFEAHQNYEDENCGGELDLAFSVGWLETELDEVWITL